MQHGTLANAAPLQSIHRALLSQSPFAYLVEVIRCMGSDDTEEAHVLGK